MARFSDGFLSTVRDRLQLSDIVGRRVSWDRRKSRPSKGDHWACCPFHGEKTPSFHVDDRRGRYHCFGCGASGDHFRFLMELEGLSFPEAVERLAGEAGLAVPQADPEAERRHQERLKLVDVLELAARFYEAQLQAPTGQMALHYAQKRGLDGTTRSQFRIGYAPDSRTALLSHLQARGVPLNALVDAGLVIVPDDGGRQPYDRFRGRLMVAIEDIRGQVVGFGGRIVGQGEPKYLNSPETELFQKRSMLFNAKRAREAAHQSSRLIVVEGYMDAIALHRAGFAETVASLGTALGEDQMALMWRFADEPIICFDGDEAGLRAANRSMDRALPILKPGKSLRFLFMPNGLDPDDFIQDRGAEAFAGALDASLPMVEALWRRETSELDVSTPERMSAFQVRLARLVGDIADATVRQNYDQALKDRFYALRREMRQGKIEGPRQRMSATVKAPSPLSIEQQLLALAQRYPDTAEQFADRDVGVLCDDQAVAILLEQALQGEAPATPTDGPVPRLPFPVLELDASPKFVRRLFHLLFAKLELKGVEADIQSALQDADRSPDDGKMTRLMAVQNEAKAMRLHIADLERQLDEEAAIARQVALRHIA